ncbi:hypothetical protein LQW54_005374 [Pestalotiopsis sp. IQ-011]
MDPHLQYRRLHDDDTAETDSGPLPRFSFELTDQSPRSLSPGGLEVIATNEVAEESPYKSMVNRNTPLFHEGLHVVEDDDNLERVSEVVLCRLLKKVHMSSKMAMNMTAKQPERCSRCQDPRKNGGGVRIASGDSILKQGSQAWWW